MRSPPIIMNSNVYNYTEIRNLLLVVWRVVLPIISCLLPGGLAPIPTLTTTMARGKLVPIAPTWCCCRSRCLVRGCQRRTRWVTGEGATHSTWIIPTLSWGSVGKTDRLSLFWIMVRKWLANWCELIDLCTSLFSLSPSVQNGGEMSELDDAGTYFDLGPRKVTSRAVYRYLSTRNNNFTNRSQKGKIVVAENSMTSARIGFNGGRAQISK